MSTGSTKRNRPQRGSALKLPPGLIERGWDVIRRGDVLLRVGMCLLAAAVIWAVTGAWDSPFQYRAGDIPNRDIVARVNFQTIDEKATEDARRAAVSKMEFVYVHDRQLLDEVRQGLKDKVFQLLAANTYEKVDKELWSEFTQRDAVKMDLARTTGGVTNSVLSALPPAVYPGRFIGLPPLDELQMAAQFDRFKAAFVDDPELEAFMDKVSRSMAEFDDRGLLDNLEHEVGEGNQTQIKVYPEGNSKFTRSVNVDKVRIVQAQIRLAENLGQAFEQPELAKMVTHWLSPRLPKTLTLDRALTTELGKEVAANEPPITRLLEKGKTTLARADERIDDAIPLLKAEHEAYKESTGYVRLVGYSLAKFGMYFAMYVLCGFYSYFRHRTLLRNSVVLGKLLAVVVASVCLSWVAAPARIELVPLLLFAMIVVIVFGQELALLLSASVALVTIISLGYGVSELVTVIASMSTTILLLRHIRTRTKLIYVGLWTAAATFATTIGVAIMTGEVADLLLVQRAAWAAACCVGAGLAMTGILPFFVEPFFEVQTDQSLLELGDVAHPLLQELVRRAPGTYNHSINVASIAQAAAESIGANGLLVRVGAYFHDIGKMLKPQYFVENQTGDNRHESLVPAMSTLVIIAHVKDGADLARQHNLPESMIDFILQHHGTTLVEYFYHRAKEQQKESDPEAEDLDEGNYRYPGPKPQTKEAAVLMLSDTVESASRALVDPAPARIESLVEDMAMKRLMDGQFDECGLTLKELRTVQDSLIKSLTAMYHGRIKYPGQQSA